MKIAALAAKTFAARLVADDLRDCVGSTVEISGA